MGLSRNKVAVSEGAAGSPPFYGESNLPEIMVSRNRSQKQKEVVVKVLITCCSIFRDYRREWSLIETEQLENRE